MSAGTIETSLPVPPWDGSDVVYEVYVPTFCEHQPEGATWQGKGNLPGVTTKLDYLRGLGVSALWLTPFYPSGGVDGGYDVTSYTDVAPEYGAAEDFSI